MRRRKVPARLVSAKRPGDPPQVRFERPRLGQLRSDGLLAADLHVHTNHSDSFTPVKAALKLARKRGVGLAITDHNTPSGAHEARRLDPELVVVPGMEITAADGPHLLLYFYSFSEMETFYRREVERHKGESPYLATGRTTVELLEAARGYNVLTTAAHPYGYLFFNKGVGKSVERGDVAEDAYRRLHAVEALNGSMSRGVNRRAVDLAAQRRFVLTGGTDAHRLGDLGHVVTVAEASDLEGFLDAIAKGRASVVGLEKGPWGKVATAAHLTARFVPHTLPSLKVHYRQNAPRVRRYLRRRAEARHQAKG